MADNGNGTRRTSSDVWDRLDQQSDSISDIARAQSATEANLASLAKSVETGFDHIEASISRLVDQHNQPINWIGIGSLLIVVIGALLTFVALQTDPVRIKAMENDGRIDQAFERELINAETRGQMQARIDQLEKEMRLIDQYGSRRWIADDE